MNQAEFYHAARAIMYADTDNGFNDKNCMSLESALADIFNGCCAGFMHDVAEGTIAIMGGSEASEAIWESAMAYGVLLGFQRCWGPQSGGALTPEEMLVLSTYHLEMIK